MTDLDTIMSERSEDAAPEQNAPAALQEQQSTTDQGQPRDPHGRFAANEQQPAQTVEQQPVDPQSQPQRPPDGFIPIQALDARLAKERERHDAALRQQAEQFQRQMAAHLPQAPKPEPVKPPDFYENPDAAFDHRIQQRVEPIEQGQQSLREDFSKMLAFEKFGEETVKAAFSEMANRMATDPRGTQFDYQRIMANPHPFGELVKWHKAQSALKTYGDDPEAWRTAERERLRAEIAAEQGGQQQQPQTSPAVDPSQMPSSFAQARNGGPSTTPVWNGPRPLSELMPR